MLVNRSRPKPKEYVLFSFYISYIVEYVLLCDACISAEGFWVQLSVKVGIYRSLHPNVNWKCFEVSEAKKCTAGSDFVADAIYFF